MSMATLPCDMESYDTSVPEGNAWGLEPHHFTAEQLNVEAEVDKWTKIKLAILLNVSKMRSGRLGHLF